MSGEQFENLVDDVSNLAVKLLEDPNTEQIIKSAGISEHFSSEETEIIRNFSVNFDFLKAFSDQPLMNANAIANIDIAVGVARQISAGVFSEINGSAAQLLIQNNVVLPRTKFSEIETREIDFDTFSKIFDEYIQLPELPSLVNDWKRALKEEDSAHEHFLNANAPAENIMRRYGLVRGTNFANIAFQIFNRKLDFQNPSVLRELVNENNKTNWAKIVDKKND